MSLVEKIKEDRITALKAGDKARSGFLSFLHAECVRIGKDDAKGPRETTDAEAIQKIKKLIDSGKAVRESLVAHPTPGHETQIAKADGEISIMESYLPKQLTEDELRVVIDQAVATIPAPVSMKNMKIVMAYLEAHYQGQYDRGSASQIAKSKLSA
jgi:uncharacterized protein YqeY